MRKLFGKQKNHKNCDKITEKVMVFSKQEH